VTTGLGEEASGTFLTDSAPEQKIEMPLLKNFITEFYHKYPRDMLAMLPYF